MKHTQLSSELLKFLFIPAYVSPYQLDAAFKVVARSSLNFAGSTIEIYVLAASHALVCKLVNGISFCEVFFCSQEGKEKQGVFADYSAENLSQIKGSPVPKALGKTSYIFDVCPFSWEKGLPIYTKIRELANTASKNISKNRIGIVCPFPLGNDPITPETVIHCEITRESLFQETIHTYYPKEIVRSSTRVIF